MSKTVLSLQSNFSPKNSAPSPLRNSKIGSGTSKLNEIVKLWTCFGPYFVYIFSFITENTYCESFQVIPTESEETQLWKVLVVK